MQQSFFTPTRFIPEPADFERWKGHKVKVFNVLRDGLWHTRDEIVTRTEVKGFTARISDVRKAGYLIECNRANDDGATIYRILEFVGYDTTGKHTCPTCTCKLSKPQSEMQLPKLS